MKNILEYLYGQPGKIHEQDSPFVRTAHVKQETWEQLDATLTAEQKDLLGAYFEADTQIEEIMQFDSFRYAFHMGAQLMAELIEGKEELLS